MRAFLLAFAGAGLAGALVGFATRIDGPAPTPLVAAWVDHLRTPLVPDNVAAVADRTAIAGLACLDADPLHLAGGMTAELLQSRLRRRPDDPDKPRVVYVSAYATCDEHGDVQLAAEDYQPLTTDGVVPLASVLESLDRHRAPVLLVLDLDWGLAHASAGLAPCGVGQRVLDCLGEHPSPSRWTLLSCSPGQRPSLLDGGARTAIGYFFETGLKGAADGWGPSGVTDARVSAGELCRYVSQSVAQWTRRVGSASQTPIVLRADGADFLVASVLPSSQWAPALTAPTDYPAWLADAWADHDAWRDGLVGQAAPRLVRRWAAALADAERRWRAGAEPESLGRWFATQTDPLRREATLLESRYASRPIVSLAQQAERTGAPPAQLVDAWATWLDAAGAPAGNKAAAALDEAIAGADADRAAAAAIAALAQTTHGFRERLQAAKERLATLEPSNNWVEVTLLDQLLEISAGRPAATDAIVAEFFQTALLGHHLRADPAAIERVGGSIAEGDRHWRTAWAMAASPGYASLDEAVAFARRARQSYARARSDWRIIGAAIATRNQAFSVLSEAGRLSRDPAALSSDWSHAVDASRRLADSLSASTPSAARPPLRWLDRLQAETETLAASLDTLLRPTRGAAIDSLVARIRSEGSISAVSEGERLLETSLIAAPQRVELVMALNSVANDRFDRLARFVAEGTGRRARESTYAATRPDDAAQCRAEAQRFAALVGLTGLGPSVCSEVDDALNDDAPPVALLSAIRGSTAAAFERVHAVASLKELDRLARVLPAGGHDPVFDQPEAGPSWELLTRRADTADRLYAQRLLAESTDLGGTPRLAEAARRLGLTDAPAPLALAAEPLRMPTLAPETPAAQVTAPMPARAAGADVPVVRVTAFQPADSLAIHSIYDAAASQLSVDASVKPAASIAQVAATKGFLLRLTSGAGVAHLRVETPALADVPPVAFYADIAGQRLRIGDLLKLPPTAIATPLRLIAVNQTDSPRAADLSLLAGEQFTGSIQLAPLGEAAVVLTPTTKPDPAAPPTAIERIEIECRDPEGQRVVARAAAQVQVADPVAYIEIPDARVETDSQGVVSVSIDTTRLAGSPAGLMVSASVTDASGESLAADAALQRALTPSAPGAALRATLSPAAVAGEAIVVELAISGVPTTLRWVGSAPPPGVSAALQRPAAPVVQLRAPRMIAAGEPLTAAVSAAPAVAGAKILLQLRGDGAVLASRSLTATRKGLVTLGPPTPDGALLVSATHGDWREEIDTASQSGKRVLVATVVDADGRSIAEAAREVVIDSDPADRLAVHAVGAAVAGKPLALRIDARDPLTGVQQVRAYAGAPDASLAPPKGAPLVTAAQAPDSPGQWIAALPTAAGAPAVLVTVEATNGVGLVRRITKRIDLTSPEQAALGGVAGAVSEGPRPQPGVEVELLSEAREPVATATTDARGAFRFDAVKPGKYYVTAVKAATQRVGVQAVEVQAGAQATAELKLSL